MPVKDLLGNMTETHFVKVTSTETRVWTDRSRRGRWVGPRAPGGLGECRSFRRGKVRCREVRRVEVR